MFSAHSTAGSAGHSLSGPARILACLALLLPLTLTQTGVYYANQVVDLNQATVSLAERSTHDLFRLAIRSSMWPIRI